MITVMVIICIVIVFTLIILITSPEPNDYNHHMVEYQLNVARGVSKTQLQIKNIETNIEHLKTIIETNEKHIEYLTKTYPEGSHYILNPVLPQHFNRVELCGDKEIDDKHLEVLSEQNKLEDVIYKQNHIIKVYNKYCVNRKFTYDSLYNNKNRDII